MKFTLRQLVVFDAVATHGSVVRAAEKLCMSQAACSAALRDLQLALERPPLFRRSGRSLKITAEGRRLQPRARALLEDAREMEMPADPNHMVGTLALGAAIGNYRVPRLCASFYRKYPDVRISVVMGQTLDILDKLNSLELDMVITDGLTRMPGAVLTECYRERSVLFAATDHPLAKRLDLTFDDLAAAEWCMPERSSKTNIRLMEAVRGKLTNFQVAMEANNNEAIREAVKAGVGIACLPITILEADLQSGSIAELAVEGFTINSPTFLVRMRNTKRSKVAEAFESHLLEWEASAQQP